MKITNNPSVVQYIAKNSKTQKPETKNNLSSSSDFIAETSNTGKNNILLTKLNTMQKEHIQSQQMFGALTQLTEALELFRRQPDAFEQNIKEVLAEVRKNFPQLSKYIKNHLENPQEMIADVDNLRQELSQKISREKKVIASYLVAEQNKDAVQKKSVNHQNVIDISKQLTKNTATELYTSRPEQVTKLLS